MFSFTVWYLKVYQYSGGTYIRVRNWLVLIFLMDFGPNVEVVQKIVHDQLCFLVRTDMHCCICSDKQHLSMWVICHIKVCNRSQDHGAFQTHSRLLQSYF